jgi:hypothetical protein
MEETPCSGALQKKLQALEQIAIRVSKTDEIIGAEMSGIVLG